MRTLVPTKDECVDFRIATSKTAPRIIKLVESSYSAARSLKVLRKELESAKSLVQPVQVVSGDEILATPDLHA